MIDYRTHIVALNSCASDLKANVFPDPAVAAQQNEQLDDVNQERGMAVLGALLDHLLQHAASDGTELALLERAASLWKEGLALYTKLGDTRANIETALLKPADPASAALFIDSLNGIRQTALDLVTNNKLDEITALNQDVMKLAHLPEHPRQIDKKLQDWGWGDVFLARRTDAFVRCAFHSAQNPAQRALAFGALSGYSANAHGSAYLDQVVGGPRRSHRYRTRIASYAIGSWFALKPQSTVKSLAAAADLIRFGAAPGAQALPAEVEAFITEALRQTYDLSHTAPLPDLQVGYQRLVRHLELLDGFHLPPKPALPADTFLMAIYGDPSNPPQPLYTPKAADPASNPGPGAGSSHPTNYHGQGQTPTQTDSAPTTGERCGHFWLSILYAVMFLAGGWAPCLGQWVQKKRCKLWDEIGKEFGEANRPSQAQMEKLAEQGQHLTAEDFQAVASVGQLNDLVGKYYELQCSLWEGLGKALGFLAIYGLVYPDELLSSPANELLLPANLRHYPVFEQFYTVPAGGNLPHRPEADPAPNFHKYPATVLENPAFGSSPYAAGAAPDVFVGPSPQNAPFMPNASQAAVQTWWQIATGALDASNYDLDADRGFQATCWATQGSINSDPVGVQSLGYEDI